MSDGAGPSNAAFLPAALAVEHVSHAYGVRMALDDVSFEVAPASFAVLLGLNGAGKSTLFSIVTRLYAAGGGKVRVFGFDLARQSGAALARIGAVFQSRTLDLDLTVDQNFAYQAALHGLARDEARARGSALLARVGLADRAHDRVRELSGGQMRRVEIARALIHRPRLLLLDEPTAGLDIRARADILALTRGLVATDGVGVLWTTHLVDEVKPDDRIIVLHEGRVLAANRAQAVMAAAGARTVGEAFGRLTGEAEEADS
jgi:ABC-2 type transport system ATP-binding protein